MKIIKITSLGCPSCIIMNNLINEFIQDKDIEIIEYNADYDEEVEKYNVGNIYPVIILQNNNKEERIIGEKSKKEFFEIINKYMSGE